jgi:hypothetical protein
LQFNKQEPQTKKIKISKEQLAAGAEITAILDAAGITHKRRLESERDKKNIKNYFARHPKI